MSRTFTPDWYIYSQEEPFVFSPYDVEFSARLLESSGVVDLKEMRVKATPSSQTTYTGPSQGYVDDKENNDASGQERVDVVVNLSPILEANSVKYAFCEVLKDEVAQHYLQMELV